MRFVLVDRVVHLEPGRAIETLKNVSATEDVFDDHFPGCPIFPGALVVEAFEQSAQLLIATTHAFGAVGRLERLSRASFRHFVRPGDQLRVRCERRDAGAERWTVLASAHVDGRPVAGATLELAIAPCGESAERLAEAERWRALARALGDTPLARAGLGAS